MEEQQGNVAEEIQQEAVVSPHGEPQAQDHSPEAEQKEEKVRYSKDENLYRLREAKEQLEKENRELRLMREKERSSDEDFSIDDDDLVDGKTVKKLYNELKELKKFRTSYESEKQASIPDRLKTKYSDFEQVVTKENIDKLKQIEPEMYSSITSGSDLYTKGVSAYKTLKAMGIVKEDHYKSQKEQVHQNHSKPVSTQAIRGQGALSEANMFARGLTPELKKQLQAEMQDALKAR